MTDVYVEAIARAKAAGRRPRLTTLATRQLDERGRCCGRKPIRYQRPKPYVFCARCNAAFDVDGVQVANWAYRPVSGGFETASWNLSEAIAEQINAGRLDSACIIREVEL